jgi:integrase/recombinase XerD
MILGVLRLKIALRRSPLMTPDQSLPELQQKEVVVPKRFDPRTATPFVNKSVSEETHLAYRKTVADFFQFAGGKHPTEVVPNDIICWRDHLRHSRKRAATVSFKLSVIRSFFEYLKAGGVIPLNPASTKLVTPPELPTEPAGRALTAKEVRHLLTGPDREKPEGARDYSLMLVMLRLSMRVAEVCSLRASSIKWSYGRWTLRCKVKGGREEVWPLPKDVKQAVDEYLKLDAQRRATLHSDEDAFLFQPHSNYRTLVFDKALSTRMVQNIVAK